MDYKKQIEIDFSDIPALTVEQISSLSLDLSTGQNNIMPSTSVVDDALISFGATGAVGSTGTHDTITLTSPYSFTTNTSTMGSISPVTSGNGILTINSDVTMPWAKSSAKIALHGDDADIELNGKSLMKVLAGIEERLNILTPNTELESDWEELAELGKKYRELETKIKEKARTWDILKAMPPPKID